MAFNEIENLMFAKQDATRLDKQVLFHDVESIFVSQYKKELYS
jgi:hypothetical protein